MVDLSIIRKRKAKKIIIIVGAASLVTVAVISAVALLGQHASPLTVSLNNSGASLTLSETGNTEDGDKTSFLLAKDVPGYQEIDGNLINQNYTDAYLDSEKNQDSIIATTEGDYKVTLFFKYTFFIENNGENAADYLLTLNISNQNRNVSEFDLTDILRVRFYENFDLDKHEYKTYAKPASVFDEETNQYVDVPVPIGKNMGNAEMFESNRVALKSEVKNFEAGQKVRYTFVIWLEGNDIDSYGKMAPVGSSLSLGVNISAHEATGETSEESSN